MACVDVRWNSRMARDQFRIIGEEGEIGLDPLNGPELRVAGRVEMLPPHANLHYPMVENFVDAVLANDPGRLACPAEQASWTDWVIEQVGAEVRHSSQGFPARLRKFASQPATIFLAVLLACNESRPASSHKSEAALRSPWASARIWAA